MWFSGMPCRQCVRSQLWIEVPSYEEGSAEFPPLETLRPLFDARTAEFERQNSALPFSRSTHNGQRTRG